MTGFRPLEYPRLAWVLACGVVLIGVAVMALLFPGWRPAVPWPRPSAPRVVLMGFGNVLGPKASEWRAVQSPALIALSQGAAIQKKTVKQEHDVNPPVTLPPELPIGLERPGFAPDVSPMTEAQEALLRKDVSGVGVSSGIRKTPVFRKAPSSETRGVTLDYGKGLEGKRVEVAGWSWEPWIQSGVPWTLGLDIQSDEQGRIIHVFLETPAAEASLNDALIQSLYQQGRVRPAGPCRGHVDISFSGRP